MATSASTSFTGGDSGIPAKTNGWVGNESAASSKSSIACFAAREIRASSCVPRDALLKSIRYVITLDSDTQLPRDVARKLVGAAIHPLNQPGIDPVTNRVTYGYGILQPRVSISLASASRSKFVQIFPATPASILTPRQSPTFTRTSSAKETSPAKVSTTSTLFNKHSITAFRRTHC